MVPDTPKAVELPVVSVSVPNAWPLAHVFAVVVPKASESVFDENVSGYVSVGVPTTPEPLVERSEF